jgi:tetratricopeptide (TPR) repeat protein
MGRIILIFAALGLLVAGTTRAATNEDDVVWQHNVIQNYQALQEQQQATVHAFEQARHDSEATAKRNAEEFDARLKQIEQGLTAQHEREVAALQSAHRFTLTVVSVVAGVGFFGLLGVVLIVVRALNRRQAMMEATVLPAGGAALMALDPAQQSSARFRASLDRLEQRLGELESTAQTTDARPSVEAAARVALLMGKGQTLLNLQQADGALACFDEVIELDATNPDAFVKKGTALEKLGRLDEAIDCYDQAIALDTSMTMAYLCKGGVFNRLERYGEALQCYEQALRAQQKASVA